MLLRRKIFVRWTIKLVEVKGMETIEHEFRLRGPVQPSEEVIKSTLKSFGGQRVIEMLNRGAPKGFGRVDSGGVFTDGMNLRRWRYVK